MKEHRLLKEINFSYNNIGDDGCKSLYKFLHLGKIFMMNLSNCGITNTGMLYLCKMMRKESCAVTPKRRLTLPITGCRTTIHVLPHLYP